MRQVGLILPGVGVSVKTKLDGTDAPTVNDDTNEGYVISSRWFDITNDKEYVCLDDTNGAAVWIETTGSGSGSLSEKIGFSAEIFYLPVTNPATLTEEIGSTVYAGQSHLDFDDTTAEHAVCRSPGVIDYDGGNMVITMTAKPTTTPGSAKTLIFHIYVVGIADGEAYDSAVTVDTGVDIIFNFSASTLQTDIMTATATINPANVANGNKLVLEFIRNVATDTLVGDGELIDFDIIYTKA